MTGVIDHFIHPEGRALGFAHTLMTVNRRLYKFRMQQPTSGKEPCVKETVN